MAVKPPGDRPAPKLAERASRRRLAGRALQRLIGDHQFIIYPAGGAAPLKAWSLRHRARMRDGYGSHMNGRHKMG